ncbi:MAG: PQQ-binding-like beta-propeller repeat protein [Rubripirellula sp.]
MQLSRLISHVLVCFFACLCIFAVTPVRAENGSSWPQWRGAQQNGVAPGDAFPTKWSEDDGVEWKAELQGKGGSTPVVSGNAAYLTMGNDKKNMLQAFDIETGKVQWEVALGTDRGNKHAKGSGSNPSAIADGDSVFAYFRSGDLACVGADGKTRWHINLQDKYGEDSLWWDLGSSPMLTDEAIVVAVMQTGPSYLAAYDKKTGDELWKVDRMLGAPEEAAQSYSTPLAVTVDGKPAIAVMGADHLTLHDGTNGKEIGRLGGFNPDGEKYFRSISSPVAIGNLIVCPYSRGNTLTAVNMDQLASGKGKDAIAWFRDDLGSDVPTPAALQNRVYVVGDGKKARGKISCLDVATGKSLWTVQLPKSRIGYSSSPLVAGDHLYVTQENGTTHVIGPLSSSQPEVVSENKIGDDGQFTVASPIPVDDSLLLRSKNHLYRLK